MAELADVAPAFVDMAHRIVWATVATVDTEGRARTRILHPIWEWDGAELVIPMWSDGPTSPRFAGLRLEPWRLKVQPASVMLRGAVEDRLIWSV